MSTMATNAAYDPAEEPEQYARNEFITPARARELLELNRVNRRMSAVHKRRWQDIITHGRYHTTHQGIAFDENGELVDGQTRLAALAEMNIPGLWMAVSYNVLRAGFKVMDTGNTRRPGQLIPAPNANTKAAAARILIDYPKLTPPHGRHEPQVIVDLYDDLATWLEPANELAQVVYRRARISASAHTALLAVVVASEFPRDKIEAWCDGLATGSGLDVDDPRLALRNRFALEWQHLNTTSTNGFKDALWLITRAWNAYVRGERLTKLQLPRGGVTEIPEVER